MERSLGTLLIVMLVLGTAGPALSQTYYGNAYQGQPQAQTYAPQGQGYGQYGYQQSYGGQSNQGQAAYGRQNYSGYYQNYGAYMNSRQAAGQAAAAPNPYPTLYQRQTQPNPYYGVNRTPQLWRNPRGSGSTVTQDSTTEVPSARTAVATPRTAPAPRRASASQGIDTSDMFEDGTGDSKTEIYWDPDKPVEEPRQEAVSSQGGGPTTRIREARVAPRSSALTTPRTSRSITGRSPGSTRRNITRSSKPRSIPPAPTAKRSRSWGKNATPKPPSRRAVGWGKKENKPPARTAMKWGKAASPPPRPQAARKWGKEAATTPRPQSTRKWGKEAPKAPIGSARKWGKPATPTGLSPEPGTGTPKETTDGVRVESKAPPSQFQWGKN